MRRRKSRAVNPIHALSCFHSSGNAEVKMLSIMHHFWLTWRMLPLWESQMQLLFFDVYVWDFFRCSSCRRAVYRYAKVIRQKKSN